MEINWKKEVDLRKESFIQELTTLLKIKSVYDETTIGEMAPFGEGIQQALEYMLQLGEQDGFVPKNVDGYAGHLDYGTGKEILGILCHLDVVPEGDDWDTDPYGAVIKDGKIYARGAMDDKGPTMAAYFAMKIVKELGLPLSKKVRIIFGGDEESDWRCMNHYFAKEKMPDVGFAPDADFPLIYAEKGICDLRFSFEEKNKKGILQSFHSGRRLNMVPDLAVAVVAEAGAAWEEKFQLFLQTHHLQGKCVREEGGMRFEVKGKSAHGAEPQHGRNAAIYLADFLSDFDLVETEKAFISFLAHTFKNDMEGKKLGIAFCDDVSGALTVNVGVASYNVGIGGHVSINVRYPVQTDADAMFAKCEEVALQNRAEFTILNNSKPHHVDIEHPLVKTLLQVYRQQTGDQRPPIAIGGGTYARTLETGVAFGALFPGKEEVYHQKNEYAEIDDLLKATAIYAQAIWELAK